MLQLGNLAIICAKRPDVSLTISKGIAAMTVREGSDQKRFTANWQDNAEIEKLIHELNFGKLRQNSTQQE